MDLKEYLMNNILLFDGGMGTYYAQKSTNYGSSCELANLSQPDLILDIHREYLEAGARAIKTNTFSANRMAFQGDDELTVRVIEEGWKLASKAAEEIADEKKRWIFADIGPVTGIPETMSSAEEYIFVADQFIRLGAENFLFETNSSAEGILEAAGYIKNILPDSFILVSFAVQPDGYTREGCFVTDLFETIRDAGSIDAIGLNCVCGARHMLELVRNLDHTGILLSLMPNAGYPVVVNNRTFYEGDPIYFASQLAEMAAEGAVILGGCCGTTPLHIGQTAQLLQGTIRQTPAQKKKDLRQQEVSLQDSLFWEKLQSGKKVIAVELDPPADVKLGKFMAGAWNLKEKNVDIITIADCPIARARMDSSLLACKLHRELNLDALPHMTCRDRNLNATKALLMGMYAEGIRNVLLITGDPIPTAERDEVKSVYQFNSRKLASFVTGLNNTLFPTPLHVFGALNLNARNFDVQIRLAKDKLEKGMSGFLTQPVLTPEAFENLKRAREELDGYILVGIIPVVSEKNARFMDSEVNGIRVDQKLIKLYKGKNREEAEELAVEISTEIAKKTAPYADGFYIMTPFQRVSLVGRIIDNIDKEGLR